MHTLFKPDGIEMKVNDTSLLHALKLGWTKENPKATKKAVKSGNSTKRSK